MKELSENVGLLLFRFCKAIVLPVCGVFWKCLAVTSLPEVPYLFEHLLCNLDS